MFRVVVRFEVSVAVLCEDSTVLGWFVSGLVHSCGSKVNSASSSSGVLGPFSSCRWRHCNFFTALETINLATPCHIPKDLNPKFKELLLMLDLLNFQMFHWICQNMRGETRSGGVKCIYMVLGLRERRVTWIWVSWLKKTVFAVSDGEDLDIRNRSEMKTVGIRYS